LHEVIDRGVEASADEAAATLDRLTALLANHAPQFEGEALSHAVELADRIVALSQSAGRRSEHRLRDCHIVFAAQAQKRLWHRDPSAAEQVARNAQNEGSPTAIPHDAERAPDTAIDLAPLAGGGLPLAPAPSRPLRLPVEITADARPLRDAKKETVARLSPMTPATEQPDNTIVSTNSGSAEPPSTEITRAAGATSHRAEQAVLRSQVWPSPQPASHEPSAPPPAELKQLLDWAQRVRGADATAAKAAREELKRHGVDERQLNLARGAVDSDPHIRQEVVEALPLVDSVDTRGWLLWFSHDRDAEVRRAAISLLATSSDPELKKRVRQAAATDPDPRVREQARAAAFGVR
jgi:hypothetical protein